jgi:alkylation response protein AidB-like acyl-CoA dehydrogenase
MREEFTEVGAPLPASPGAVLMMHGTEQQQREHLPRLARGEERWCQGFSEPGAGSDLASLTTSAVRDGDEYIVNGQKIWTSNAHEADYIWALVRTDKEVPKHRGISMLLIDMHAPGVSIRPIISMPGTHHHNEVFFADVRVPFSNLIGEENRGWYQAAAHLDVERSSIGGVLQMRKFLERSLKGLPNWRSKPGLEYEVAERWIELTIARLLSQRVVWLQATESDGTTLAASMAKLYATELKQRVVNTVMKMLGLPAMLLAEGNPGRAVHGEISDLCVPSQYLNCVGATMGGGTSEIQRNVMAERGLGLPRS